MHLMFLRAFVIGLVIAVLASEAQATSKLPFERAILKEANEVYGSILGSNDRFEIIRVEGNLKTSPSVHESAGLTFPVYLNARLLRDARFTEDGYRFALCHELGYVFGGMPHLPMVYSLKELLARANKHLASEAQADYYAALVCFRRLVAKSDSPLKLDDRIELGPGNAICRTAWKRAEDISVCARTIAAAENIIRILRSPEGSLKNPIGSAAGVNRYFSCRQSLIKAGALCTRSEVLDLADMQDSEFGCHHGAGKRPQCVFSQVVH